MTVEEFAPAKLNLALHVTGRRPDGYHLLDSLVVFVDAGDTIRLSEAADLTLLIEGPQAAGLVTDGNLVLRAAEAAGGRAAITLVKRLPIAAGLGGGSADAAATLRALARLGRPLPEAPERLGADVPACLAGRPLRMRGIGEHLTPLDALPPLAFVLANDGTTLPTPEVFAGLTRRRNPGLADTPPSDRCAFVDWLARQRNDLEPAACRLRPGIADVLAMLRADPACRLARMTGSGATCLAICDGRAEAERAAARLRAVRPGWWIVACASL